MSFETPPINIIQEAYFRSVYPSSNSQAVNVPKLRFPGFEEEWKTVKLGCAGNFYGGLTGKSKDDFGCGTSKYITYKNVFSNTFASEDTLENVNVDNSEHQNHVESGDVLFTQSSETFEEVGMSSVWLHDSQPYLNSFCMGWRPSLECLNSIFMGYLLRCPTTRTQIIRQGQGISRINLAASRIADIKLCYPQADEQNKIASFLKIVDSRIEKQQALVDALKLYKRGVMQRLFNELAENKKIPLSNICTISTGKLDANKNVYNGIYPFFTCSKETLWINSYSFDGEAILIAGNGDIGHTKYYNGKFEAYQRTYVLMHSSYDMHYLKSAIDVFLPSKIHEETQGGAMPYIKLSTLNTLLLPQIEKDEQHKIANIEIKLSHQIDVLSNEMENLSELKNGLLQQMFI